MSYFAAYGEPDDQDERAAIFKHMRDLADIFPGPIQLGPQVTKTAFKSGTHSASMIHFHGHATYAGDEPLKSALVLSDGNHIFDIGHEDLSSEALSSEALSAGPGTDF